MNKSALKAMALSTILGTILAFGGCLGFGSWKNAVWTAAGYTALEYVLDSNAVFDLFDDGPAT